MWNITADKELASDFLDIALERNSFSEFLLGDPMFKLIVKDPYGNDVFSAMHVMEAIYDKYRKDPSSGIDKLTFQTMLHELQTNRYEKDILNLFEDITYHISAQKNGTTPFGLDCIKLLEALKENVKRNEEIYKYPKYKDKPNGIWPDIEMYNARIEQTIGHKIL